MPQYKSIVILLLAITIARPALAAADRDAISTSQIAAAISNVGMKTSVEQVTLLTAVVARTSSPILKVQSIEPWGDHRMKVRLGCPDSNECLPFYVGIRDEYDAAGLAAVVPAMFRSSTINTRIRALGEHFVVHPGSPAVLFLVGDHMHIEVAVICLENGDVGQTVRVSSRDHRKTYSAEIVNSGTLKGRL